MLFVVIICCQTNSATTLDLFLPTSGDRPFYGAMVERRDGPSWLRDDDDDDLLKRNIEINQSIKTDLAYIASCVASESEEANRDIQTMS